MNFELHRAKTGLEHWGLMRCQFFKDCYEMGVSARHASWWRMRENGYRFFVIKVSQHAHHVKDTWYTWRKISKKFVNTQHYYYWTYQKSEWFFFRQCSMDRKSGLKVEKRYLVAELKLKMSHFAYLTFSISAQPPGGILPLWLHFYHLWTLGQNSIIHIFDTSWLDKNFKQNVKTECFCASCTCISGTLKNTMRGDHCRDS